MFKRKYKLTIIDSKWNLIKKDYKLFILPNKGDYLFFNDKYHEVLGRIHQLDKKANFIIIIDEMKASFKIKSIDS